MFKKWKNISISLFFAIIISIIIKKSGLIEFDSFIDFQNSKDLYWNIINLNAIISGFMFTSLGIILSTADGKVMRYLATSTIVDKMYINIVFGIWAGIFSIALSLLMIFINENIFEYLKNIIPMVLIISIIFTLQCFIKVSIIFNLQCFIKSTKDIWHIIKQTRQKALNEKMSHERRQKVYEQIKK